VLVDPIKPMLEPPGSKHLKLECDELLSSVAFNFILRRYNMVSAVCEETGAFPAQLHRYLLIKRYVVGRCRLKPGRPQVDP